MYIPIGPSKNQLYKIIIILLLIIFSFFLCIFKPKAEEFNWVWSGMQTNGYNSNALGWQESYSSLKGASNWRGSSFNSNTGSVQFYHGGGFTIPNTIKYGFLKGYFAFYNSEESVPSGVRLNSGNTRTTICSIDNVGDAFNTLYSDGTTSKSTNGGIYSFSCYLLPGANYNNIEIVNSIGTSNWSTYIYMKMSFDYYFSDNSQTVNNIQNNTNDIKNSINDSTVDNTATNNTISNLGNNIHSNGTITNLLTLPVTFIQRFINSMSGSCSSLIIGTLWGTEFKLPCVDLTSFSTILTIVDTIVAGFLAYNFGKKMILIFNNFTNMKEGGLEQAYD